jgi:uncharacterized protein
MIDPPRGSLRGPLAGHTESRRPRRNRHPPANLPRGLRIFLMVAGWVLIVIGVAGLVLPILQGAITIVAGAALLAVASEKAYWLLRRAFRRWPRGWRRVERVRRWIYRRVVGDPHAPRGRTARTLERWEETLLRRLRSSWRLLPLVLVSAMLVIAAGVEPLVYERSLWTTKLPLALLLALAFIQRRGRDRKGGGADPA